MKSGHEFRLSFNYKLQWKESFSLFKNDIRILWFALNDKLTINFSLDKEYVKSLVNCIEYDQ